MRTVALVTELVRANSRLLVAVVSLVAAIVVAGCETSSTVSTGPEPVKCQVSVAAPPAILDAAGANSSITVTTLPECAWTASTSANWITGLSPTSGQGNGTVSFRAAANDGTSVREATILVNNEQARVSQRAPCRYTLSPATQTIATSGGASTVTLTATEADCAWTATTDVEWISLAAPTSGAGSAVINFTAVPNQGGDRNGTIIVAGQRANVLQSAAAPPDCNILISPTAQNVPAAGASGSISVQALSVCDWGATSNVPWITVTAGSRGRGDGAVMFSVAANTGAARTGTIAIGPRNFTVSQAAGAAPPTPPACTYTIAPQSQTVPSGAGPGTVNVTTTAACAWTAVSNAPWLTVTSGAAGTGNGTVAFSVAANTGAARTGTLTIATQTFTVTQSAFVAPCSYTIAPTSQNVDANASTPTVAVTTTAACSWTAVSGVPWITVTSGASGTGNGSVGLSVAANTGAARSGTVAIAGQTFTVNQAAFVAPCSYSIAPTSQSVPVLGGTGTVTVTTTSACTWTATSNAPWLSITSGATGTGSGTVGFAAAANTGAQRTGTLTIAGQTFTVTQPAVLGPVVSR
ncbi:MAG TPA: BACON domain-containing carbohydrate-binding protein [Vicinamibacterales bacterium]